MALADRIIPIYDPKIDNPAFNGAFQENSRIVDPVYENTTVFEIKDSRQSDQLIRDRMARDVFNQRAVELQRLVDAGWGSMAMMRETGDPKKRIVLYHQGDGFAWAEHHLLNDDLVKDGAFQRESIGLLHNEQISKLANAAGLEIGEVPPELMLLTYLQRIANFSWMNSPEMLDRIESLDNALKTNSTQEHSPIVNAEFDNQLEHSWVYKTDESTGEQIRVITPEDAFPSELPQLEATASHIYLTRGSNQHESRNALSHDPNSVIFSRVGKHWRLETTGAPMPTSQGSIEYLSTLARLNALALVPRNDQLADIGFRLEFARKLLEDLDARTIPEMEQEHLDKAHKMWKRNVGVAIGINDQEIDSIKEFMKLGIRTFRLYTVATDSRMKEQLQKIFKIIDEFKEENDEEDIELFVGQMTHPDQLGQAGNYGMRQGEEDDENLYQMFEGFDEHTIQKYIAGLYFGNGGGSTCSTASTGMGVNTTLLLHRFRNDPRFKKASFIVEGGISVKEFPLLQIGADAESIASQAVAVESPGGQLAYVSPKRSEWAYDIPRVAKPQVGEASATSSQIEDLLSGVTRMDEGTGMPLQTEGQESLKFIDQQMPSVSQILRERLKYLSQVFVKMGVRTIEQLHTIGTFQTAASMELIFGPNWRKQRALGVVRSHDYQQWADHLRKILQAPSEISDHAILLRAGIDTRSNYEYYIIPTHMRLATSEQRNEGSPSGAGLSTIK